MPFAYRSFEIYPLVQQLTREAAAVARSLPREWRPIADQLVRAAVSVSLNLAEGAGEYMPKEKSRFHRIARRSAYEVSAVADVLRGEGLETTGRLAGMDALAERIAAQLTRMVKKVERPHSGSPNSPNSPNSPGKA